MSSKNMALVWVPGSWLSTDIYLRMASRLGEYRSIVIDQPTNKMRPGSKDMHEDIDHTRYIIENELDLGNDVVVIAHSAGGLIGSHATRGLSKAARLYAGQPSGVVGFIGVAALMPFPGKTVVEMIADFGIRKQNSLATKWAPPKNSFEDISEMYTFNEDSTTDNLDPYYLLYNDLAPGEAEFWINKHELQSSALYGLKGPETCITNEIPAFYIHTTRDNAVPSVLQEKYALVTRTPDNVFEMESDHVPHLSHPIELEKLLRKALEGIKQVP